jgi:hypothetical protein
VKLYNLGCQRSNEFGSSRFWHQPSECKMNKGMQGARVSTQHDVRQRGNTACNILFGWSMKFSVNDAHILIPWQW